MHDGALQVLAAARHHVSSSEDWLRMWEALGLHCAGSTTANERRTQPPLVRDGLKWVLFHLGFVRAHAIDVVELKPVRLAVERLSSYVQKHDRGVVLNERAWPAEFPPRHFLDSHLVSTYRSTFMHLNNTKRDAALGLLNRVASAMEPVSESVQLFPPHERWKVFSEGLLFSKATFLDGKEIMLPACMPFDVKFTETPCDMSQRGCYVSPTKGGNYLQVIVGREDVEDVQEGSGGVLPRRSPRFLEGSSGSVLASASSSAYTSTPPYSHQAPSGSSWWSGRQGGSSESEATSRGVCTSSAGIISVARRKKRVVRARAHQIVAELFWGPPPKGKGLTDVAHLCGRYQCLNPLHLQHTTRAINAIQTPDYIRTHGMENLGLCNGMWGFDSFVDLLCEGV